MYAQKIRKRIEYVLGLEIQSFRARISLLLLEGVRRLACCLGSRRMGIVSPLEVMHIVDGRLGYTMIGDAPDHIPDDDIFPEGRDYEVLVTDDSPRLGIIPDEGSIVSICHR